MCGICGSTEDPTGAAVAVMNDALRHRGPDDGGVYMDEAAGVAVGARRLSIIDVEGGHQPLGNEDGRVWAALNGEIYNHPALRTRLSDRGHRLATATDTEVLVHLYEDYGDALVHALEGMFAFALWDSGRRRLLLARDRFGEKPLFYAERDGQLTFASELTALMLGASIERELEPAALDAYFVLGYVPGPGSIVSGVRQLPPGHLLVWDADSGRSEIHCYWSPPLGSSNGAGGDVPNPELVGETRALLESSVRSRMISDVPLGVFLSGGLDSTLIAAIAATCSRDPIKTFTVGYEVGEVSETGPARRAAQDVGADHHELTLTESEVARRVPELFGSLDQPLADPALVPLNAVAEFARKTVTVTVGGEGADELFGGYPRYRWLARGERLDGRLPAAVASRGARLLRAVPVPGRARRLVDVIDPAPRFERHLDWVSERRRHLRDGLYGPLLRPHAHGSAALDAIDARMPSAARNGPAADLMRLDQLLWLPDDVLAKADRASMLASLEVRTPYLNREIAEFAAGVSTGTHLAHGGKALLRAVLDQVAPEARARPKTAFRVPAGDWLRGALAPVLGEQLRSGVLYEEGWFDRAAVGRLADEHSAGTRDWSEALWPLLALGLWLDRFRGAHA